MTASTQTVFGRRCVGAAFLASISLLGAFSLSNMSKVSAANLVFRPVADTQISTATPDETRGDSIKMAVCGTGAPVCSQDGADEKRAIVKFVVSGVRTSVQSATLRLYATSQPVPAMRIVQITDNSWEENTATWNNASDLPTSDKVYASPAGNVQGWYEADVTGAVTGDGTYSFAIINSQGTVVRFATKETATAPELVLTTSGAEPPATTVPEAEDDMDVYFGVTHAHTGAHNTHGRDSSTAADNFAAARTSGYDFLLLTEHSGPTGPADASGYYADAQAQAAAYTAAGEFVGLAGYEYSDNGNDGDSDSGHLTGWGTKEFVNAAAPGVGFSRFFDILTTQAASREVFAGFNHPPATGHTASAPMLLTPERREVVVMSETSNGSGYDASRESGYYEGFVQELDRGWRVAPTCGMDTHGLYGLTWLESSSHKPCRTGLLATSLTRDSVIGAFMDRRIYSTRDSNMHVQYKVNGAWMGATVGTPAQASFDVRVSDPDTSAAADRITRIEIIGNGGAVLASKNFSAHDVSWQPSVMTGSNTYMFIRIYSGERTQHTAVAAPVWFE